MPDGHYLLVSTFNPRSGRNEYVSQGDSRVTDWLVHHQADWRGLNLDSRLVDVYTEEIESFGMPAPLSLEVEDVSLNTDPLSISWKNFSLRQLPDNFELVFQEPGTELECRLHLVPHSRRYSTEESDLLNSHPMEYVTYPRLDLTGLVGDEGVVGEAWFDHQWGDFGLFIAQPSRGKVRGWDWFGINGNDGSDWIIIVDRDAESNSILSQTAIVFEQNGDPRVYRNITVSPTRYWVSEKTHIRFPVSWRIGIPEISGILLVEPLFDDQEIPVLGMMRAVWEGAASASGTIGGRPFEGRARLELHGYGYVSDFSEYLRSFLSEIDDVLLDFLPKEINEEQYRKFVGDPSWVHDLDAFNATISKPVWDLLSRQKKNWRPAFGMLLLEALGIPFEKFKTLVTVIPELTHTGTLIIDDIEDDALMRRGEECIHRRYGLDVAINAANTLYFLPYVLIPDHPHVNDKQRLELYAIATKAFIRGHFGQALDIYWSKFLSNDNLAAWSGSHLKEKVLQMYEYKTASAAVAVAEACCSVAGVDDATRDACVSFARSLGVAFQLIDDTRGFDESPQEAGMKGDDLAAGKPTYLLIRALDLLDEGDSRRLREILCLKDLRSDATVLGEGIELVRTSGALQVCLEEARSMMDEGWKKFSLNVPQSEPKIMLRLFSLNLISEGKGTR